MKTFRVISTQGPCRILKELCAVLLPIFDVYTSEIHFSKVKKTGRHFKIALSR